ncbi:MAG: TonB-dependent receptor [Microscillaceae bacterium]|nr:TonB-dependent receptor [Microscillaceae bacterium]
MLLAQSATVRGRVSDASGAPLPFASLYAEGTSIGTTTNEEGDYSLRLAPGTYQLVFQFVGFKKQVQSITMAGEDILLDVTLSAEALLLKDILVEASDQDPAYAIIRQAQNKRRYYLEEEVKAYQCQVYVKGLQRLNKKPNRLMGVRIDLDTGIVYLSESLSELSYQQPGQFKERMIASKVSGNNRAFSFNQASEAWLNLYENISAEEITERGLVSPIAANALAYYRYRLEGAFYDKGQLINKIRVIPRRKQAPAYHGFLYITEGTWRIHSSDLHLKKGAVEFVDSVAIQQVYSPVGPDGIWLPLSQKVSFDFEGFGFKGTGYFVFVYSKYAVEPAFPAKHFDRTVITVEKEANKKDSVFWETVRPMPLTLEEKLDYREKDSLELIRESPAYRDSVDAERNRISIGEILWAGYTYEKSARKKSFSFQPLFSTFQWNTVEGLVTDFTLNYRKRYEDRQSFSISPTLRYGFANERLQAKLAASYRFAPLKNAQISVEGGQYVEQISRTTSISPFVNAVYTLLREQNYLKLYEKAFAELRYQQLLFPGVRLYAELEYAQRRPMQNNSDYRFRDVPERDFTSNVPQSRETIDPSFARHEALLLGVVMLFDIKQKYALYPDQRFVIESKYPTFRLNYRRGIPILGSDVNYDFLTLGLFDEVYLGLVGEMSYNVEFGRFLSNRQMTFVDYRHFLGNQTIFYREAFGGFQLLDYYLYSTNQQYVLANFEHHFNGFLLNAIPLLKKLKWQTVVSANYLYTEASRYYLELGLGIEHIFKILRVDFITALQSNEKVNTGFRVGFGF